MDWVHLHLAGNHLPVIGLPFLLVLCGVAAWRGDRWWSRFFLAGLVLLFVATLAVKVAGDRASMSLRSERWYDDSLVRRHEQAADRAVTALFLLTLGAGAGWVVSRKGRAVPRWQIAVVMIVGGASVVLLAVAANSGGQIRHPEIGRGGITETR